MQSAIMDLWCFHGVVHRDSSGSLNVDWLNLGLRVVGLEKAPGNCSNANHHEHAELATCVRWAPTHEQPQREQRQIRMIKPSMHRRRGRRWLSLLLSLWQCVVCLASTSSSRDSDGDAPRAQGSSDFVAMYYRLYLSQLAGNASTAVLSRLDLADDAVPHEVQDRLLAHVLPFGELPPLMQRALLWDTGYSLAESNASTIAQIYTLCGSSMADIALSASEFAATDCVINSCSVSRSNTTTTVAFAHQCRASRLVVGAKCSTTAVPTESSTPLWVAHDTSLTRPKTSQLPDITVMRHRWFENELKQDVHVFAIHSHSDALDKENSVCSPGASHDLLTIPCVPFQRVDKRWCRPKSSELMETWLNDFADDFHRSKKREIDAANAEVLQLRNNSVILVKDANGVMVDSNFSFDGTSSDLAQQFYRRFLKGETPPQMTIETTLPLEIRQRLNEVSLEFSDLPVLLQRALVWDSGFAFGDGNTLAAIYVRCGSTMAEIALSRRGFTLAGCQEQKCADEGTREAFYRTDQCTGDQLAAASLCATADVNTPVHVSVWADGGYDELVPDVNVQRHTWEDRNRSYLIYGIHMIRSEVAQANCPARGAMIIPCLPYGAVGDSGRWCRPKPGALVTSWLRYTAKGKQFNLLLLLPILLSAALIVSGVAFCFRHRVWWQRANGKSVRLDHELSHTTLNSMSHHQASAIDDDGFEFVEPPSSAFDRSERMTAASMSSRSSIESFAATSANTVLDTLVNNTFLANRRIELSNIRFDRLIAKGGHGEVWLCRWQSSDVAVKRLLRTRKYRFEDVEAFTREITLTASMDHPNIVQFVGVAWNTLQSLCMVTEYMANGDLLQYIRRTGTTSQWTNDKVRIAEGIACALAYLHHRDPPTIHRDLKSKNVLLSKELKAKLIDFGVSRSQLGDMMTKGVGTPYWTAPEILQGQPYTEKADIYSFGIVLCEIDTGATPYQDMRTSDGTPEFTPLQILQNVVAGQLRPTISDACPPVIAELVHVCLCTDPNRRPSSSRVLSILQSCEIDGAGHLQEGLHVSRHSMAYHL